MVFTGFGEVITSSVSGVANVVLISPFSVVAAAVVVGNVVVSGATWGSVLLELVPFIKIIVGFNTITSVLLDILLVVSFSK